MSVFNILLGTGAAATFAACAPVPAERIDIPDRPGDAERYYAIWLGGAQVGTAHEVERWSQTELAMERTETLRFLRGDVPITVATAIEITAGANLAASRVTWTETGQATRRAEAVHDAAGWTVTGDAGPPSLRIPRAAVPAELVPLLVRRDGRFAGDVFLPARGFVAGPAVIAPIAPDRLVARLALAAGPSPGRDASAATATATTGATAKATTDATAEATIDLGPDGMPARVVDGDGVIAVRITAAEAAVPFAPVDLIAATSIPLTGPAGTDDAADAPGAPGAPGAPADDRRGSPARRLVLDGDLALPPLPGQAAHPGADGLELELSPRLGGGLPAGPAGPDRTRDIIWLVTSVRHRIVPDLAATPTSADAARAAATGDCTTFALAYAALAAARAIPTRVVTGFRIDGDRLVRHRWAVSWTGAAWIAVDAAFGAVPAGGDLVGLAVHDADDVGLVAGEAALTRLRAARWQSTVRRLGGRCAGSIARLPCHGTVAPSSR